MAGMPASAGARRCGADRGGRARAGTSPARSRNHRHGSGRRSRSPLESRRARPGRPARGRAPGRLRLRLGLPVRLPRRVASLRRLALPARARPTTIVGRGLIVRCPAGARRRPAGLPLAGADERQPHAGALRRDLGLLPRSLLRARAIDPIRQRRRGRARRASAIAALARPGWERSRTSGIPRSSVSSASTTAHVPDWARS